MGAKADKIRYSMRKFALPLLFIGIIAPTIMPVRASCETHAAAPMGIEDAPVDLLRVWLRFHEIDLCQEIDTVFVFNKNGMEVWSRVEDDKSYRKFENLLELAQVMNQQIDFEEILNVLTKRSADMLKAEVVLILMVNPRTHKTVKTIFNEGQKNSGRKYRLAQNLISGWVMDNEKSLLINDIESDDRFIDKDITYEVIKSAMCPRCQT